MSNNHERSPAALSRRRFLTTLGVGAAACTLPAAASADTGSVEHKGELCTLLDISKCIACGECVEACRETNGHKYPEPTKPFPEMVPAGRAKPEDWSEKRDLDDRLTPYNWLFIQTAEVEHNGEQHELNVPRRCLHCTNPPCADLCPFGAAAKQSNGIVRIYPEICFGGAKCRNVCPWHIPQRQSGVGIYRHIMPRFAGNGVMYKCDRCYDRVSGGEMPACIEVCPEDVQKIGPREEIVAEARKLAEERGWYLYGIDENGGTNTIYLSPVPFEKLHKAVEKGKGRPGLQPVPNMLQTEERLANAVFLAPVVGLAAGLLRFGVKTGNSFKTRKENADG